MDDTRAVELGGNLKASQPLWNKNIIMKIFVAMGMKVLDFAKALQTNVIKSYCITFVPILYFYFSKVWLWLVIS